MLDHCDEFHGSKSCFSVELRGRTLASGLKVDLADSSLTKVCEERLKKRGTDSTALHGRINAHLLKVVLRAGYPGLAMPHREGDEPASTRRVSVK